MNNKDILILAGLGFLYMMTRPGHASAQTLPQRYPTTPQQTPQKSGGGSGGGSGSGGGFPSGGTTSPGTSSTGGTPNYGPIDQLSGPGECADGSYVDDVSLCPENQDSMDPCDPNSSVYDPTTCYGQPANTGTPPGYVDSMDPCDPNSSVYDPTVCYSYQNPVDPMDPCDPNSVAYDENVCAGYL